VQRAVGQRIVTHRPILAQAPEASTIAGMIRRAIATVLVCMAAPCGFAAAAVQPGGDQAVTCYYADRPGVRAVTLPGGYTARLERVRGDAVEDACTIHVRDGRGREVFKGEGFGTQVLRAHLDVDADGVPDAIVGVDSGGGNRCCWTYTVLRLGTAPATLATLPFSPWIDTDSAGRVVLVEYAALYDLGPSMAESPTIVRVHRIVGGRLADVTADHCQALLAATGSGRLSRADEWALVTPARAAASRAGDPVSEEGRQTRVAAMSLVLQLDYCGRTDEAAKTVADVWPASDVPDMQKTLAAAVAALRNPRR
jgi:hypothetical protein